MCVVLPRSPCGGTGCPPRTPLGLPKPKPPIIDVFAKGEVRRTDHPGLIAAVTVSPVNHEPRAFMPLATQIRSLSLPLNPMPEARKRVGIDSDQRETSPLPLDFHGPRLSRPGPRPRNSRPWMCEACRQIWLGEDCARRNRHRNL